MTSIEELNPSIKGIGRYEFGWADENAVSANAKRGLNEEVVRDISGKKSEPQFGIGFLSKIDSARSRRWSIQSGSLFFAEMSRTTASDSPRCALAPAASLSDHPKP